MKTIASFTVNHDKLKKGIYVSRVDGDIVTYDIRMKVPNGGDYLTAAGAHSFEHLFATLARNSCYTDSIIYVGPMGCLTGFYLVTRNEMSKEAVIALVQSCFAEIAKWEGEIPGATKIQCGNYALQDPAEAKALGADMTKVLAGWTPEMMVYEV